jgi:hypothetical protein
VSIDIATARPVLLIAGTERPTPFPILFVQVDGLWKTSIKK